jgi:hypothetical protein
VQKPEEEKKEDEEKKEVKWNPKAFDWTVTDGNPKDVLKVFKKIYPKLSHVINYNFRIK